MSEPLSFLEEDEPVAAPEAAAEPTPEPTPAPLTEPEPALEPQPEPSPPPAPEPSPQPVIEPERQAPHVPLAAHLDERERRQRAEQEREQFRAEAERLRATQARPEPQEPEKIPDPYEDPEGFTRYIRAENARVAENNKTDLSYSYALRTHGQELVDKATAWYRALPPAAQDDVRSRPDPYDFAVQQARRAEAYSAIQDPSEVQAFLAWKAAQEQAAALALTPPQAPAAPVAPPQQPSPTPPRSLASAPSAGGLQVQVEAGDPFDEEFKRKK